MKEANSMLLLTLITVCTVKKLLFGIASSPAIFQPAMDIALQGIDNVACIQEDILMFGKDVADNSECSCAL